MNRPDAAWVTLEAAAQKLEQGGDVDLAREVMAAIHELRWPRASEPAGGLLTTGDAAAMLGVRSINTIKRWAGEGILQGYRRGHRIYVSRESVEHLLNSPTLAEQKAREKKLADDLAVLELADEREAQTEWVGRRPWSGADARTAR